MTLLYLDTTAVIEGTVTAAAAGTPISPAAAAPDDTPRRRISGQLVPYGVIAHPNGPWYAVRFAPGAIEEPVPAGSVKFLRDHDPRQAIGRMDVHSQDDQGVFGSFVVSAVPGGDHALTLAADGVLDGLSVGVEVIDSRSITVDGQDVEEITHATLREVSLVPFPAYATARVTDVAATDRNPTVTTPTAPAAPAPAAPALVPTPTPADPLTDLNPAQRDLVRAAVADVIAQMAPATATPLAPAIPGQVAAAAPAGLFLDPDGYGRNAPAYVGRDGRRITAGDYFGAYFQAREGDRTRLNEITAALAHETTAQIPGLLPTPIVGPLVNVLDASRPVFASMTQRPMPTVGGTFQRPRVTQHVQVGAQTAEKTEIPSRQLIIGLDDVAKRTIAGALNLSVQAIDWSSPALLDIVISDFTDMYAVWSETDISTAFVAALAANTPIVVAADDADAVQDALIDGTVASWTNGEVNPNRIWMSIDVWGYFAKLKDTTGRRIWPRLGPQNADGTLDPGDPRAGSLPLQHVVGRHLPAGTCIIGPSQYSEVFEDRRGFMRADEPSVLGRQLAIYGYLANYVHTPAAFTRITLTPPAGLMAAESAPAAKK